MNASAVTQALAVFQTLPLKDAARQLLAQLGYMSAVTQTDPP